MTFLMKLSSAEVSRALLESIEKWKSAEEKIEFCDPRVPLLIKINGKKYYVLSIGGDPDEEGIILEAKPTSYWD